MSQAVLYFNSFGHHFKYSQSCNLGNAIKHNSYTVLTPLSSNNQTPPTIVIHWSIKINVDKIVGRRHPLNRSLGNGLDVRRKRHCDHGNLNHEKQQQTQLKKGSIKTSNSDSTQVGSISSMMGFGQYNPEPKGSDSNGLQRPVLLTNFRFIRQWLCYIIITIRTASRSKNDTNLCVGWRKQSTR